MRLQTIAPHEPFLQTLGAQWLAEAGNDPLAVADGLILLPTRRAARALVDAFLADTDGRPLLLPRIAAFGALDEAPLALAGTLALPPAVAEPVRLAHLTRLVMALDGKFGAPGTADQAWPLAVELAALMDEAERAEIDLPEVLPTLVGETYASHWGITLDFLRIVSRAWPQWLLDNGLMNPAARQVALLDAQARTWTDTPPKTPVVAAGTTGGIPAVARLLRVIAGLPRGRVVLPGLDLGLAEEAWGTLEDSHPQAGLSRLLIRLGATRGDVQPVPAAQAVPAGRTALLNRALLPAEALAQWRDPAPMDTAGLSRLAPTDQQEEALAIALILRGALEVPDHRAALVTPDRELAGRVAVELGRFGVVADDSAGEALACTPPAVFLRLLAGRRDGGAAARPVAGVVEASARRRRAGSGPVPQRRPLAGARGAAGPGAEGRVRRVAHRDPERTRPRVPGPAGGLPPPHPGCRRRRGRGPRRCLARLARHGRGDGGHAGRNGCPASVVRRGRPGARGPAGRVAAGAGDPAAAAPRDAARAAGCHAGRRRGAQPPGAARAWRGGASPRVHLGPAGGAAATRRHHRARRPGRGRLAQRRRPWPLDEPPDARRRQAAIAGGGGRPDGA